MRSRKSFFTTLLAYVPIRTRFSTEERGRAFEALVGAQLLRTGEELSCWRVGNAEVDFVLKKGKFHKAGATFAALYRLSAITRLIIFGVPYEYHIHCHYALFTPAQLRALSGES